MSAHPPDPELARHVLDVWARDAAAFAEVLSVLDPSWGTETFPLAGGHAVLCGPGLYVNRALGIGLGVTVDGGDLDRLEERSDAVGVPAAVEVTPLTDRALVAELAARGYVADDVDTAVVLPLDRLHDDDVGDVAAGTFAIEAANAELLPVWQETAAAGWGHADAGARRASDAFARAAAVVDGPNFVVVCDLADGRPVGCASVTIRDGVATLGGMSTVPAERRRGVQAALIAHRLGVARAAGCALAVSLAVPGGPSLRNLRRHGFTPWFDVTTHVRRSR